MTPEEYLAINLNSIIEDSATGVLYTLENNSYLYHAWDHKLNRRITPEEVDASTGSLWVMNKSIGKGVSINPSNYGSFSIKKIEEILNRPDFHAIQIADIENHLREIGNRLLSLRIIF